MMLVRQNQRQEIYHLIILLTVNLTRYQTEKRLVKVRIKDAVMAILYENYFVIVVSVWQMHQPSAVKRNDPRDFKKLNKMSLKEGIVTAKDQYNYRSSHDARIAFGVI